MKVKQNIKIQLTKKKHSIWELNDRDLENKVNLNIWMWKMEAHIFMATV